MYANPVGLIILAVIALVAGIVLLWTHSEGFRNFFIGMWEWIKVAAVTAVLWIHDHIDMLIDFVTHLPGRVTAAARGLWDGLVVSFKAAVNWLLRLWNNFSLTLGGGTVLGVSIPSITLATPDLPYLADGGIVPATPGGRLLVAGEGREDEAVIPLSKLGTTGGGAGGMVRVVFDVTGADEDMKRLIRKMVRVDGPNSVQLTFGKT